MNSPAPYRAAVLTVSTSRSAGSAVDESGPALTEAVRAAGGTVVLTEIVPDDQNLIAGRLSAIAASGECDLILTTGGTGCAPSDVTPEATLDVIDREVPGIAEQIRRVATETTPHGMLSRGVAGACGSVLIINLPGSVRGCLESFAACEAALEHAVALLRGSDAGWHAPT